MKKFLFLLSATMLFSCSDDDSAPVDTFPGTYKITSMVSLSGPVDLNNDGITSTDMYQEFSSPYHRANGALEIVYDFNDPSAFAHVEPDTGVYDDYYYWYSPNEGLVDLHIPSNYGSSQITNPDGTVEIDHYGYVLSKVIWRREMDTIRAYNMNRVHLDGYINSIIQTPNGMKANATIRMYGFFSMNLLGCEITYEKVSSPAEQ
jgi:hypothetical protein